MRKGGAARGGTSIRGSDVNFFFDDADIYEVIQTVFGDVLKVNYIIDPKVKGRVNFRTVAPIPRDEVLPVMEIILRLNGVGYIEENGLYRIVPLDQVSRELVYSQVGKSPDQVAVELFTFKHTNLKEAMPDIENAIGLQLKGGIVRVLPILRLNALMVVASTKEQLDYIRKWIEDLDTMFLSARPKVYVYPLQNGKADYVASILDSLFTGTAPSATSGQAPTGPSQAKSTLSSSPASSPSSSSASTSPTAKSSTSAPSSTASAPPKIGGSSGAPGTGSLVSADTRVFADPINNALVILATPVDYTFIEETIRKIDVLPRQVVIEGLIFRVDLTDNLNFGAAWSFSSNISITGLKPFTRPINLQNTSTANPGLLNTSNLPTTGFTFVGTDPTGNVRAVLTALASESKAKILAAPHLLVSDNREARIQVGSQVPIATSTTTTTAVVGVTPSITNTIEYKDIGIILKVKPQINDSGLVSLEIEQEVSSLGTPVSLSTGTTDITIDKEEVTTDLIAQDNETIVIGGLIREDSSKSRDGIPILSKIPILGSLFGNTTNESDRTEILILLTPHVLKSQKDAVNATSGYVEKYKSNNKDATIDEFIKGGGQKQPGGTTNKDSLYPLFPE
ncbi:MAG: secretin N-terminal domain-containing protein [Dissulfurispiraceae bacterium]